MVNDVRGLFLKINQVDLPYQVFDNLGDLEAVDETQVDVLAPLPVIARPAEEEYEPIEVDPESDRTHGARKVIASIRQRVFQGFSVPTPQTKAMTPQPQSASMTEPTHAIADTASSTPVPAPIPLFAAAKPAAPKAGSGLLRRYAPAAATSTAPPLAGRGTPLKSLFDRLASGG